jgi:hypothetical protein
MLSLTLCGLDKSTIPEGFAPQATSHRASRDNRVSVLPSREAVYSNEDAACSIPDQKGSYISANGVDLRLPARTIGRLVRGDVRESVCKMPSCSLNIWVESPLITDQQVDIVWGLGHFGARNLYRGRVNHCV